MPNTRSSNVPAEVARMIAAAERCVEAKEYEAAHNLCLEALKAAPKHGEAFMLLGVIAAEHVNHTKALELFDRAATLLERPARALALKARSLIALNRRADAIAAAEAAASGNPRDSFTLDTLGVVFSRAGLHERAAP
jgi:tetratricopeptide (TPR) repeat protein